MSVSDLQGNNHNLLETGQNETIFCPVMYVLVFLLYEGLYDCSRLISLCTIMSHLTFSCISLCHTFSYTQDGATPLYVACQNGHKQTVDVLLKNGANVNRTRTVSLINPLCTLTERVMVLCLDCVSAMKLICMKCFSYVSNFILECVCVPLQSDPKNCVSNL